MKLLNKQHFFFFSLLFTTLLLYSCKNRAGKFYYNDRTEKTEYEKQAAEMYLNDVPKEYQKTDKDVLVIFNGGAFKGKTIIINNKDSISFDVKPESAGCYGVILRKIPKSEKKIRLSIQGKRDIVIPILEKYDYIDVGDTFDKTKWGVGYSKILLGFFCM
jgi:hypothetical protein